MKQFGKRVNQLRAEEYRFNYDTSRCIDGDTLMIHQDVFGDAPPYFNMPDNYEYGFNFFIAQNCNLKVPLISQFKKFKQNFNDGD